MRKILKGFMTLGLIFTSLFTVVGCDKNDDPPATRYKIDLIETTRDGIGWELGEYGEWLNEGEYYFICRAVRGNDNPAEIFNPYNDAFIEGNTYYLFFFDSNITSIKINNVEKFNDSKYFTQQEIKDLYYDQSSLDYMYNDLFDKGDITGQLIDQEERVMPIDMNDYSNVRVISFVYDEDIRIKIS